MSDIDVLNKAKQKTKELIESGELELAKEMVEKYKDLLKDDAEIYSMRAVIAMMEGKTEEAENILLEGCKIDKYNFDLLYNLGFLYENKGEFNEAINYYKKTKLYCYDVEIDKELEDKLSSLIEYYCIEDKVIVNGAKDEHKKVVFFVKRGMDTFLVDIINSLSKDYNVKQILINKSEDFKLIDTWMQWADVAWFEWCDELVIYASKLPIAWDKKIICRVHSYEVFTSYPKEVKWEVIDKIIFVAKHVCDFAIDNFNITNGKTIVIPNGVNLNNWRFRKKGAGFNIAYVGYINYKKGPMLLLHTFKAIFDKDSRYKFYIAGKFIDNRDILYFQQTVKEFGLETNFFFEGWQDNLDEWLDDKDYILCTSIFESQNMSVMQSMSKGIKPIIHNFVGAKQVYNEKYIWNTMEEAIKMITSNEYNSSEYRKFIEDNYSLDKQMNSIRCLIRYINFGNIKKRQIGTNICIFYHDSIEIKFYLPFMNDYIQKVIYTSKNFYEIGMLGDIKKRLGENKIIIDAGANIGNHTVYFSKICKADKVYSFEPQKNIYEILKRNVEINNMKDKVELYNIGLGNEHFYANIDIVDENNLGMSKINKDTKGTIEIDTLDNVLLTELNRVDMIKVDVEGMEIDVLKGAKEILRKFKPIVYIEAATDEEFRNVTIYLEQYGYQTTVRFNATPTYLFI